MLTADEFEYWFEHGVFQYATLIEVVLQEPESCSATYGNKLPPHFYSHLTRTDEGCRILDQAGHLKVFVDIVADFEEQMTTAQGLVKLRAALWTVGHVGSNSRYTQIENLTRKRIQLVAEHQCN